MLRTGVKETAPRGVFSYGLHVVIAGNAVDDRRPRFAVVMRPEDVRLQVAEKWLLDRDVSPTGVERRSINLADPAEVRHRPRRHVRPALSAVTCDVDEPVVRPCPQDVDICLARAEREDRGVDLRAVHVMCDRTARVAERLRIVAREIAA